MRQVTKLAAIVLLSGLAAVAAAQRPGYKREVPARLLRQTKISEDSALKVASARVPSGRVQALELENEKGILIWSFTFVVTPFRGVYEVNVNAVTGALVGNVRHEMPADTAPKAAPRPQS